MRYRTGGQTLDRQTDRQTCVLGGCASKNKVKQPNIRIILEKVEDEHQLTYYGRKFLKFLFVRGKVKGKMKHFFFKSFITFLMCETNIYINQLFQPMKKIFFKVFNFSNFLYTNHSLR